VLTAPKINTDEDGTPRLELTPGTRIQAKLETQISSAVLTPVVAVVEYTYAGWIEAQRAHRIDHQIILLQCLEAFGGNANQIEAGQQGGTRIRACARCRTRCCNVGGQIA
jgi:hypothetical protein